MECTNCGSPLAEGVSFCENCGAPVAAAPVNVDAIGASLESTVQANQDMLASMEERAQEAEIEAARLAEAEAAAVTDSEYAQQPYPGGQVADEQGYTPPSYGRPEAPAGYQPPSAAAGAATAAGAAAAAPFYQQDVSPNAHFSSQRSYEAGAYGQDTGQPGYRPPQYSQPAGYAQDQTWPAQTNTNKAFAMTLYVANLLGIIFALVVRDKDNEFITHHLNNCVVILIGVVIGTLLSAVFIGFILIVYLIVMTIMGIVSAYNGDMKELPLIGKIKIVK